MTDLTLAATQFIAGGGTREEWLLIFERAATNHQSFLQAIAEAEDEDDGKESLQ
jgi:hypothetical protein